MSAKFRTYIERLFEEQRSHPALCNRNPHRATPASRFQTASLLELRQLQDLTYARVKKKASSLPPMVHKVSSHLARQAWTIYSGHFNDKRQTLRGPASKNTLLWFCWVEQKNLPVAESWPYGLNVPAEASGTGKANKSIPYAKQSMKTSWSKWEKYYFPQQPWFQIQFFPACFTGSKPSHWTELYNSTQTEGPLNL